MKKRNDKQEFLEAENAVLKTELSRANAKFDEASETTADLKRKLLEVSKGRQVQSIVKGIA